MGVWSFGTYRTVSVGPPVKLEAANAVGTPTSGVTRAVTNKTVR
jgi:hypothetical protein